MTHENRINSLILYLVNEMQNIDNVIHMQIFHEKYLEFKSLKVIAKEIDMFFSYGKAFVAFENMHSDVLADEKME